MLTFQGRFMFCIREKEITLFFYSGHFRDVVFALCGKDEGESLNYKSMGKFGKVIFQKLT